LPLFARARIEVYLPDSDKPVYAELLDAFEKEMTYGFGGCTVIHGLDGSYLASIGIVVRDRVNLLYCDSHFSFTGNYDTLSLYADKLREAALKALEEEAILVVVYPVYHSQ
jgi:hypothetical protein